MEMYAELPTFAVVLAMKCSAELQMHSVAALPGSGRLEGLMTAQSNARVRTESSLTVIAVSAVLVFSVCNVDKKQDQN